MQEKSGYARIHESKCIFGGWQLRFDWRSKRFQGVYILMMIKADGLVLYVGLGGFLWGVVGLENSNVVIGHNSS